MNTEKERKKRREEKVIGNYIPDFTNKGIFESDSVI